MFPGEHHLAGFAVEDDGANVTMSIHARDRRMALELRAHEIDTLPPNSLFESLTVASAFFESGCIGYSVTRDACRLDGIRLQTESWRVGPLAVEQVESSFFADEVTFPPGSVVFDHALVMRNLRHAWHEEPAPLASLAPGQG